MAEKAEKMNDLRVERTRRAIQQAFHEMVNEGAKRITVKELAERAGINRKTFYLHYDSIEALYSEELERILDDYFDNYETTPEAPEDIAGHAIRFFLYLAQQPPAIERLICTPAYFDDFGDKLYRHQMDRYASAGNPFEDLPYVSYGKSELVLSFIRSTALGFTANGSETTNRSTRTKRQSSWRPSPAMASIGFLWTSSAISWPPRRRQAPLGFRFSRKSGKAAQTSRQCPTRP